MDNKNTILYQDNRITQARYEFTVIEKRIIYLIIREIRNKYVTGDSNNNLFGDLVLNLRADQLKTVSDDSNTVYRSIRKLISKFYEFENDEEWIILSIINKAKHKKKDALWQITVDADMVSKFIELARNYTAYSLTVAMSLRSEYSQRFYEYCSQYKNVGGVRIPVKDLRFKMKLDKKYVRYASFKKRVIDVAHSELKRMYQHNQSDLYFEYSESKIGRSVDSISIKIISKRNSENEPSIDDLMYFVRNDLSDMYDIKKKPKNKEFVSKIMGVLILEPDLLKHCYNKIKYIKSNIPKEEQARYLRFIINEEYLNK